MMGKLFATFKKGELVPAWIEKIESQNAVATFGADVEVYKRADGYHVYPTNKFDLDKGVIRVIRTNNELLIVNGGPTVIYAKPYGGG